MWILKSTVSLQTGKSSFLFTLPAGGSGVAISTWSPTLQRWPNTTQHDQCFSRIRLHSQRYQQGIHMLYRLVTTLKSLMIHLLSRTRLQRSRWAPGIYWSVPSYRHQEKSVQCPYHQRISTDTATDQFHIALVDKRQCKRQSQTKWQHSLQEHFWHQVHSIDSIHSYSNPSKHSPESIYRKHP